MKYVLKFSAAVLVMLVASACSDERSGSTSTPGAVSKATMATVEEAGTESTKNAEESGADMMNTAERIDAESMIVAEQASIDAMDQAGVATDEATKQTEETEGRVPQHVIEKLDLSL